MVDSGENVDDDEVWFEAEHLARSSAVRFGGEPFLRGGYGDEDLVQDRARPCLDLGRLPSWPGGPPSGHGWGSALTGLVGGVRSGQCIGFDAPGPGHGRTGLLLQLADGLALRSAGLDDVEQPLTPVVVLAEDGPADAGRRLLARWTGHDARVFRHGRASATRLAQWSELAVERAFTDAEAALAGPLREPERYRRFVDPSARGPGLLALLEESVVGWVAQLAGPGEPGEPRPVWPVVVVDGLRSWLAPGGDARELDASMAALVAAVRRGGWILFASDQALGPSLDAWLDLRLELSRGEDPARLTARVAFDRAGPSGGRVHYIWAASLGRYEPAP